MASITRAYSEVDGAVAEASSINKVIDDLYTLQNGGIGTTNLANSGVLASSIANCAVITVGIQDCAVTTIKIANCAVGPSNVSDAGLGFKGAGYESVLAIQEVF